MGVVAAVSDGAALEGYAADGGALGGTEYHAVQVGQLVQSALEGTCVGHRGIADGRPRYALEVYGVHDAPVQVGRAAVHLGSEPQHLLGVRDVVEALFVDYHEARVAGAAHCADAVLELVLVAGQLALGVRVGGILVGRAVAVQASVHIYLSVSGVSHGARIGAQRLVPYGSLAVAVQGIGDLAALQHGLEVLGRHSLLPDGNGAAQNALHVRVLLA